MVSYLYQADICFCWFCFLYCWQTRQRQRKVRDDIGWCTPLLYEANCTVRHCYYSKVQGSRLMKGRGHLKDPHIYFSALSKIRGKTFWIWWFLRKTEFPICWSVDYEVEMKCARKSLSRVSPRWQTGADPFLSLSQKVRWGHTTKPETCSLRQEL